MSSSVVPGPLADRFRRDLEITASVVLGELLHVLGRFDREVVAHAGCDQHFADARQRARLAVETDQGSMVGVEVRANARIHAGGTATCRFDLAALAGEAVHVGRRAAEIGDDARESRHVVANRLDLAQH
jgi:hypothetical protein